MFKPVVLPTRTPDPSRPVIIPRPGESEVSAAFRVLDPDHGRGLSATDRTVLVTETCAQLRRALAASAARVADLLVERSANAATIRQLQQSLSSANQALTSANLLIFDLQDQLESARADAACGSVDTAAEITWALHLEDIR